MKSQLIRVQGGLLALLCGLAATPQSKPWEDALLAARKAIRSTNLDEAGRLLQEARHSAGLNGTLDARLAVALEELARAYGGADRRPDAERAARDAIASWVELRGPDDLKLAPTWILLAEQAEAQGKTQEGESHRKRAIEILAKTLGDRHPAVSLAWSDIARRLFDRQDYIEAEGCQRRAVDVLLAMGVERNPMIQSALEYHATILRKLGREAEAQMRETEAANYRDTAGVRRVGAGAKAPRLVFKREPEYAADARAAGLEGAVVILMVIGEDGRPHNAWVIRPLGLGLDEKAVEAIKDWRFDPGQNDGGAPVAVTATVEVNFRLL